jgi:hypothetical protein
LREGKRKYGFAEEKGKHSLADKNLLSLKLEYAFPLALPRFHLAYNILIVKSS